jgi:hypothetical protein
LDGGIQAANLTDGPLAQDSVLELRNFALGTYILLRYVENAHRQHIPALIYTISELYNFSCEVRKKKKKDLKEQ